MKKIALLLLCMIGLSATAQVTFRPGIRAGVNFSKLTSTESDMRQDFYVGGFAAIKFTRFYTLQPEINYSRQGGDGVDTYFYDYDTNTEVRFEDDLEVQYLSFGLINKFTFNNAFNMHVGPFFDFETGSNYNTYNEVDMGITAGIGYTTPFGLTLEARVKKGIVDVVESEDDFFFFGEDDTNTNFLFQLGLSYTFDFKATGATN